jgi:hypothetical protein
MENKLALTDLTDLPFEPLSSLLEKAKISIGGIAKIYKALHNSQQQRQIAPPQPQSNQSTVPNFSCDIHSDSSPLPFVLITHSFLHYMFDIFLQKK